MQAIQRTALIAWPHASKGWGGCDIKFFEEAIGNHMVPFYICSTTRTMIVRRDVFQAIADPTRREIIHMLSLQSQNLSSVVNEFNVSRPAIAKHLRILTECGLVEVRAAGREKFFHAKLQRLREVSQWTDQYKVFWSQKLDALGKFLEQETTPRKKSKTTKNHKK